MSLLEKFIPGVGSAALIVPSDSPAIFQTIARIVQVFLGTRIQILTGVNDEVGVHAARDAVAANGGEIYILPGHIHQLAPIEWNVDGVSVNCVNGPSGCIRYALVDRGVIFVANAGFVGAYTQRITANDMHFNYLCINSNNNVNIGLQIEDASKNIFDVLTILEPEQIGLYMYGVNDLVGSNYFGVTHIIMENTTAALARGIVMTGTPPNGYTTVNVFNKVQIVVSNVPAASYGIDFVRNADHNTIVFIQLSGYVITSAILFNSNNPAINQNVYGNNIMDFHHEPGDHAGQVVAGRAWTRYPNTIQRWSYARGSWRGSRADFRVVSQGVEPFTWMWSGGLDSISQSVAGTGIITQNPTYLQLETGVNNGSAARVIKNFAYENVLQFNYRRFFRMSFRVEQITDQNIWIVSGQNGNHMIGFYIVDNALYGICDGGAQTTLLLQNIVAGTVYELEAHLFPACEACFYVDRTYMGSINTNLPTAMADRAMCVRIANTAGANKIIRYSYWNFKQEGLPL